MPEKQQGTAEDGSIPIHLFMSAAERAVRQVIEEMSPEERAKANRTGGHFVVGDEGLNLGHWLTLHGPRLIGEVSEERAELTRWCSMEKAGRLHLHLRHETSAESANSEKRMYGGAIRVYFKRRIYILSFSGFSAADDEKVCRYTAEEIRSMEAA